MTEEVKKYPVQRHPANITGWYLYRGVILKRDDSHRGFWGHWQATVGSISDGTRKRLSSAVRAELIRMVDDHLDGKKGGK